jgi:hypothetical protein
MQLNVLAIGRRTPHMSMYVGAVEMIPPYGVSLLNLPSSTTILSKTWDFSTVFYKFLAVLASYINAP